MKTVKYGKQEFRRTDFGSRLLAAEGEEGGGRGQLWVKGEEGEDSCGWGWEVCLKWSNILLVVARSPRLKSLRRNSCYPKILAVSHRYCMNRSTEEAGTPTFTDIDIVWYISKRRCPSFFRAPVHAVSMFPVKSVLIAPIVSKLNLYIPSRNITLLV